MDKQQVREKAAAFLDEIREGVAKILQEPGKGFNFANYVSEWSSDYSCGTICCMQGWIPVIRPDLVQYAYSYAHIYDGKLDHTRYPVEYGIPINNDLWYALTISGNQEDVGPYETLEEYCSFYEVRKLWIQISNDIRQGYLDEYLLFDLN